MRPDRRSPIAESPVPEASPSSARTHLPVLQPPDSAPANDVLHLDAERLPIGFLELDERGYVRHFSPAPNSAEAERPVGRHFFHELAPCPGVASLWPSFAAGVRARSLDLRVRCTVGGASPRPLSLHLVWSARTKSVWVLLHFEAAIPTPLPR